MNASGRLPCRSSSPHARHVSPSGSRLPTRKHHGRLGPQVRYSSHPYRYSAGTNTPPADSAASSDDDDDDLNSHPTVRKPARHSPTPPAAVTSESDDDDDDDDDLSIHPITKSTKRRHSRTPTPSPSPPPPTAKPSRAVPHDSGHGDRIIMTDDEDDDAYAAFKAARVKTRKKRIVSAKLTTTAKRRGVKQPGELAPRMLAP